MRVHRTASRTATVIAVAASLSAASLVAGLLIAAALTVERRDRSGTRR